MNNAKNLLLLFVLVILSIGCRVQDSSQEKAQQEPQVITVKKLQQHDSQTAYQRIQFAGRIATKAEKKECLSVGGKISNVGMRQAEVCIQRYPDAGKVCQDNSDCMGRCLAESRVPSQKPATGRCQVEDSLFGCRQSIENGIAQALLCID